MTASVDVSVSAAGRTVLAIDPGREKCGLALVSHPPTVVLARRVVAASELVEHVRELISVHPNVEILIGRGTGSQSVANTVGAAFPDNILRLVDERDTSRRARERYCRDNPPTGLRRLLPTGLRHPETPYDDYVAIILAEEFLRESDA